MTFTLPRHYQRYLIKCLLKELLLHAQKPLHIDTLSVSRKYSNLVLLFQPQLSEMTGAGGRGDALTGGSMGGNSGTRRLDGSLNPLVGEELYLNYNLPLSCN